ncbi:hypothetical protein D3C87_908400 [compost metagenome]
MQSEESNTLIKLAKAVIEHAPEGGDAFWGIKFSDIEAALSAAEPKPDFWDIEEARENKLATVVAPDNGTTAEVLSAVLESAEAWVPEARIIGNVRAGDIARVVRSALSAQVQDVAGDEEWQLVPKHPTGRMINAAISMVDADAPHPLILNIYRAMLAVAPAKQEG